MRPLSFWVNEENQYEFDEMLKMYMKITVFDEDERDLQNLCFEIIFNEMKRVLVIFKIKRPLLNVRRLKKNLKS